MNILHQKTLNTRLQNLVTTRDNKSTVIDDRVKYKTEQSVKFNGRHIYREPPPNSPSSS
jgi:hypothetical protein